MARTTLWGSVFVAALLAGPFVAASETTELVRATAGHVTPQQEIGAVQTNGGTVLGSVWNERNEGVPNARVRLRNLSTGRIEATVRADANGQFTFEGLQPGTYVLECVNDQGKVLALGQNFAMLPNDTIATFIRLGARVPWFADFFGNAAATAVSTAASLGVTAVAPTGQPDSPER